MLLCLAAAIKLLLSHYCGFLLTKEYYINLNGLRMHLSNISIKAKYIYILLTLVTCDFTTKCKMVPAILVVITIQSKLKENYCFFLLGPKTRSKIISLGIRTQLRLYRRSRGGKCLFHKIQSIVNN